MFNRILPEAEAERSRSGTTALVYVYFWIAGIAAIVIGSVGVYDLANSRPNVSVLKVILWLGTGVLDVIGAWLIGRYDRKGVLFVAAGLLLSVAGWIQHLPGAREAGFVVATAMALVVAWQDLSSLTGDR